MNRDVVVLADLAAVARAAANRLVARARESIAGHGTFSVALSGGSTPRALFDVLASDDYRDRIEWGRARVFWSDERCVPPDHPDSNYRLAHEALLSKVAIAPGNAHRLRGEIDPGQAALEYEQIVRREVAAPATGGAPAFDLILLGMGRDGHTASLFPGTVVLREDTRLVAANFVPRLNAHRLTFTPPLINAAASVTFMVAGSDKAETLRAVLEGEHQPEALPAQIVGPANGRVTWLVDRAAATQLRN